MQPQYSQCCSRDYDVRSNSRAVSLLADVHQLVLEATPLVLDVVQVLLDCDVVVT